MKGKIKLYVITGVLSLILLALVAAAVILTQNSTAMPFDIVVDDTAESISLWEGDDGTIYAFLPGGCSTSVRLKDGKSVKLDGSPVKNGMSLSELSEDDEHTIGWDSLHRRFVVMKGDDTPTVMMSSAEGTIAQLYESKTEREVVRTTVINEKGQVTLSDSGSVISSRGYSTRLPDKKPYNLKLTDQSRLLGMPKSKKWTLLANAYDESNLKNKMVLDFARSTKVEGTPESRYVNLYIDGEYSGLYLLCERINDLGTLDECEGQVLVTASFPEREGSGGFFTTAGGRSFELKNTEDVDDEKWDAACRILQNAETALSEGNPYGYADLESWCRHYLIEEIFGNSDIASLYYHIDTSDGRIYAGPAWDYDNAVGSSSLNKYVRTPTSFTANVPRYKDSLAGTFYSMIYNDQRFSKRMKELFADEYLPLLRKLADSGIAGYQEKVSKSLAMDRGRRKTMYEGYTVHSSAEEIQSFLSQRADFLEDVWINGNSRCTITLKRPKNASYMFLSVRPGECIVLPTETELGVAEGTEWTDEKTGKPLDTSSPVTEDMTFFAKNADVVRTVPADVKAVLALTAVFAVLLAAMIITDILRRRGSGIR